MKRYLFVILILFFSQYSTLAAEDVIWDVKDDTYLRNLIKGQTSITQVEYQKKLDTELAQDLDVELKYTDLAECLQIAVENNYLLKINSSTKKQTYWEYKNAQTQFLPNFNYGYNISDVQGTFLVGGILPLRVHEIPIQSSFNFQWETVKQGKTFFLSAQKNNTYKATTSNLEYSKDEVILNTTLAYYDLLRQKLTFDVMRTNLVEREEQKKLTQARYEIGVGDRFDVLRAEAELAKARQSYISTYNTLRLMQAKLANIMGVEILTPIYPTEVAIETRSLIDCDCDIEQLFNTALVTRDDIRAAKLNIEALKAERSSNYMDFCPKITLSYSSAMNGTARLGLYPSNTLAMSLVQPLGENLGLGSFTKIKAYNSKIEAEKYKLVNLKRNIKESILTSYYDSKNALEKVEAAKKEVSAADESLKISVVRLNVGASTFLDVLQAQNVKVQARESLINDIIEFNKAQVQLLFNSGVISIGNVLKGYKLPQTPSKVQ